MPDALQRTGRAVRELYEEYSQTLYRIAFTYMKNRYDAEDALQETFLRLIRGRVAFVDVQHEKAWLIRTVSNVCRDMLKAKSRHHLDLDAQTQLAAPEPEAAGSGTPSPGRRPQPVRKRLRPRSTAVIFLYFKEISSCGYCILISYHIRQKMSI